jgi:hypothetical protein
MPSIALALVLVGAGYDEAGIDGKSIFGLLERYASLFNDVTFLYEGSLSEARGEKERPEVKFRFQGLYASRADGATLLDVFLLDEKDKPQSRLVNSVINDRLEMLNATPDMLPRIRDRAPQSGPGGPGSLDRPDAPERIFLPWYFRTLAEPAEHDYKSEGWEEINGRRCLRVRLLHQPRSQLKGMTEDIFPTLRLWIDLERGYPLRTETYIGSHLERRTEIKHLVQLSLPDGRPIWLPAAGTTAIFSQFGGRKRVYKKEPVQIEEQVILIETVSFNKGLTDAFFSVKEHALAASDEGLRRLERELQQKPKTVVERLPMDPKSREGRLAAALTEADRQAQRLEASSPARVGAGWSDVVAPGLGILGLILTGTVLIWRWRAR